MHNQCIINNCWRSVPLPCGQYMANFWKQGGIKKPGGASFWIWRWNRPRRLLHETRALKATHNLRSDCPPGKGDWTTSRPRDYQEIRYGSWLFLSSLLIREKEKQNNAKVTKIALLFPGPWIEPRCQATLWSNDIGNNIAQNDYGHYDNKA